MILVYYLLYLGKTKVGRESSPAIHLHVSFFSSFLQFLQHCGTQHGQFKIKKDQYWESEPEKQNRRYLSNIKQERVLYTEYQHACDSVIGNLSTTCLRPSAPHQHWDNTCICDITELFLIGHFKTLIMVSRLGFETLTWQNMTDFVLWVGFQGFVFLGGFFLLTSIQAA